MTTQFRLEEIVRKEKGLLDQLADDFQYWTGHFRPVVPRRLRQFVEELSALRIDEMTPSEALTKLTKLREKYGG